MYISYDFVREIELSHAFKAFYFLTGCNGIPEIIGKVHMDLHCALVGELYPINLTFFILESPKRELLQKVKTQMTCSVMLDFI